jgi:hypothetical protein
LYSLFETTLEINDIAKEIVFFGLIQKNIFAIKVKRAIVRFGLWMIIFLSVEQYPDQNRVVLSVIHCHLKINFVMKRYTTDRKIVIHKPNFTIVGYNWS